MSTYVQEGLVSFKVISGLGALIFVLHSCLSYHFVTFEAKFGHIGVNNPYIWWSVYEHEVMIGMFKDLGSLFFTFGSKAVVHSTSR